MSLPPAGPSQPTSHEPHARAPQAVADELTPELEAALLRELRQSWQELNATFFRRALHQPILRLTRSSVVLGRWQAPHRSIELSLPLLLSNGWGVVVEVLKHEMAHQYVDEVLRAVDEPAHGPAFREVCARLGVQPDATGPLPAAGESDPARARILRRVGDLLALARSPNLHEAEAAATAAQRLMLKYNVELAATRSTSRYGFAHLGDPTGRVPEHEHILAAILADHFFVQAIWVPVYRTQEGKHGSVLEITGSEANLKIASYVHAFLRQTADRLWSQHRIDTGIKSNRDRRTFLAGVMEGFREKLAQGKRRCRQQGLVWLGDADLRRYHRQRHPHIRHVRLVGHARNEARVQGREAGRRIVLHRGIESDGSAVRGVAGRSAPLALPPARDS